MVQFILFVFLLSLTSLPRSLTDQRVGGGKTKVKLVANWTTFNILSEVDQQDARDFLSSFPIMTYWDSLKGSFRTGAIADNVASLYPALPNLVSKVNKRVYHVGQYYQIKHSVIDNNYIFMNMLVSIQSLIQQYANMSGTIEEYRRSSEFSSLLQDLQTSLLQQQQIEGTECDGDNEICKSAISLIDADGNYLLESHAEIDQRRESLDLTEVMLNLTKHLNDLEDKVQREMMAYQQQERIKQRNALHESIVKEIQDSHHRIALELQQTEKELEEIILTAEKKDFEQQKHDLQEEYNMIIASLEEEIKIAMELIAYRHEEEMKMIEESEEREQQLLTLKHDYLRKSTEEIVSVFCDEIIQFFMYLFQDVWFVFWWGRILFFSLALVVTLLEVSQSIQIIYQKLYIQKNRLYSQALRGRSWKMFLSRFIPGLKGWVYLPFHGPNGLLTRFVKNIKLQRLVYHRKTMEMLQDAFESYCIAFNHQAPLPNFLLLGSPGCGKSVTTALFTDSLTEMAYVRLSGADILALGNYANTFLKESFDRCVKNQIPTLLIIDEADHLIASRDRAKLVNSISADGVGTGNGLQQQQQQQQHVGSNCLFALLEGVRESNRYVSLMLTTRLTIDRIDSALLDRVDKLIHFPLPPMKERFCFILEHIKDQVQEFIPGENEKNLIDRLHQAAIEGDMGNNKSNDYTSSLLKDMLQSLSAHELKTHLRDHDIQQRVSCYVKTQFELPVTRELTSNGGQPSRQEQSQPPRAVDPELDHQPEVVVADNSNHTIHNHGLKSSEDLYQMIQQETLQFINQQLGNHNLFSTTNCNIQLCVKAMVLSSHGWSYRDLQKRLMNLRYSILCSESCQLTTSLWMKELTFEELK